MTVSWWNESSHKIPEAYLEKWITYVARRLQQEQAMNSQEANLDLGVAFFDEGRARELNSEFRDKDYATDILSFESEDPESLGDLALCAPVIEQQAQEHQLSFQEECAYLLLHGILHLLGYEHEGDEAEAAAMYALQDKLFAEIDKIG